MRVVKPFKLELETLTLDIEAGTTVDMLFLYIATVMASNGEGDSAKELLHKVVDNYVNSH